MSDQAAGDPRPLLLRLLSLSVLVTIASIVVVLALFHPQEIPFAPRCIWRSWTGLRCVGCGLTRALHHLLQGHLVEALRLNPLILIVPPLFLSIAGYFSLTLVSGRLPRLGEAPRWVTRLTFAVLFGFFLFRTAVDLIAKLTG